ncbi:MAG: hypothetical protein ACR2NO_02215, partial [Chloroflexota bacterium]
ARQVFCAHLVFRMPRPFFLRAVDPPPKRWQRLLPWGWRLGSVATAACVVVAALSAGTGPTSHPTGGQGASASLAKSAPERPLEARSASTARDATESRAAAPAAPPAASGDAASLGSSSGASADRSVSVEGARLQATQAPARAEAERTTNEAGQVPRSVPWGVAGLVLAAASAYAFIVERRLRAA